MLKSLSRCRACRLKWFPQRGAGAACPACGATQVGGTLELFHVGVALIALALISWMGRRALADHPLATIPAVIQAKELTADVKREDRRVPVKDRRGNQVYVPSNKVKSDKVKSTKVKRRQKAKKRSQHV